MIGWLFTVMMAKLKSTVVHILSRHQCSIHTSPSAHGSAAKQLFNVSRAKLKRKLYQEHQQHPPPGADSFYKHKANSVSKAPAHRIIPSSKLGISNDVSAAEYPTPHTYYPNDSQRSQKDRFLKYPTESELSENIFGVHPVFAALETQRRVFTSLHMRVSLYKQLASNSCSDVEHSLTNHKNGNIINDIWKRAHRLSLPIIPVNKSKLDKLSVYGVHQGLVLASTPLSVDDVNLNAISADAKAANYCLWILIDNIVDPMNLGAIIRTAVYFGADRILISPSCSKLSPVVSKASSGAMEYASLSHVPNIRKLIFSLKKMDWEIVGTTCDTVTSCEVTPSASLNSVLRRNTVVLLGNEGSGIEQNISDLCTKLVSIPSSDRCPSYIDSLNVSVATGILLSQLRFSKLLVESQ